MLAERRRQRQQHSSSSTLASSSDLQPGDCYEEMLKYVGHLARKSRRHLRRLARRRQRASTARHRANSEGAEADADASVVVVCGRGRKSPSSLESRPLRVSLCEVDDAPENDETRRFSRDRQSCASLSSTSARRPSSLQIDSSSSSSPRNSSAFASVLSLANRMSTPPVDSRKGSTGDAPATQPLAADAAPVQYLVLPLQVFGDYERSPSLTPSPGLSPAVDRVPVPTPAYLPVRSRSTSNGGSVQFADTVKTCVHRTASVGRARPPQSPLARKASILSTGANDEDNRPTSSLIKSSSFNGARRNTEKCFRFSPETKASLQVADDKARRNSEDGHRRRTSGSSVGSTVSPVLPNFLEVPTQMDLPTGPPHRMGAVGRAASFSEVEDRQQRHHPPCVPSLSVPPSTPDTAGPLSPAARTVQRRQRSFRVNDKRSMSVQHRAVRRAVSCRAPPRRTRTLSASVGRASSLNEGARGRRVAAEMAASIGSLGLFGSDFLFCSQTQLSSTADIYRRMQQRARINAALSNDSGM